MNVVKAGEGQWAQVMDKGPFGVKKRGLSSGSSRLGVSQWELLPGKKSFPFHKHHVTEEALYVLSGSCKVRGADGEVAVGPGDFVAFPAGGSPHQLFNDGKEPCIFLGLSAGMGFDIVEYPDSKKVAASVGVAGSGKRFVFQEADQVDYFKGEV